MVAMRTLEADWRRAGALHDVLIVEPCRNSAVLAMPCDIIKRQKPSCLPPQPCTTRPWLAHPWVWPQAALSAPPRSSHSEWIPLAQTVRLLQHQQTQAARPAIRGGCGWQLKQQETWEGQSSQRPPALPKRHPEAARTGMVAQPCIRIFPTRTSAVVCWKDKVHQLFSLRGDNKGCRQAAGAQQLEVCTVPGAGGVRNVRGWWDTCCQVLHSAKIRGMKAVQPRPPASQGHLHPSTTSTVPF